MPYPKLLFITFMHCLLITDIALSQLAHYQKKVEVYTEYGYLKLLNNNGDGGIATYDQSEYTTALFDVENVEGGVLIRNKWTVNYYSNDLKKICEHRIYRHVRPHALSRTLMRKERDYIYIIKTIGTDKRLNEFRDIKILILPVAGKGEEVEEVNANIPQYLDVRSFTCEVVKNKLIGIGKKPGFDRYYYIKIDLKTGAVQYERLHLPSTFYNAMSPQSFKPWSHLFQTKDHFWMYEFYTTELKEKVRQIVLHVAKIDMDGVVLLDHIFNLKSITAEMSSLYSFAPGLTFDKESETIFVIGPSNYLDQSEGNTGFLYFMKGDLNTGSEESKLINASSMIDFIPEKFKFKGLKTISSDFDQTQLIETAPKLRPMYYDPLNKSIIIDFFHGNTGFGTKLDIKFKKWRIVMNENGIPYRFGVIDEYKAYFLHDRHIKFIEPEGFNSYYWNLDEESDRIHKPTGYEFLTDEICIDTPRCPRILGTVVHKRGFDLVVLFEETNFKTTLYKTLVQ